MYIVTYTDFGETCDLHSRLLGVFENADAAAESTTADMTAVISHYGEETAKVDWTKREVWASDEEIGKVGTVWNILEA